MRLLVWLFVAIAMFGAFGVAPARADDRQEAAREFAKGQAADKRRDWTAAIDHYKRANDLLPHPYAIYNIATDYERLGRFRDAAQWFDAYLDAAPSANDRERVNKKILDLRNRPAKILVRSFPVGATVKIQGLPAGSTPLTTEREGGIYRIVVEKDGDRDARDITIEYGEPVEIDVQLRERPATPGAQPGPGETRPQPKVSPNQRVLNGVLVIHGSPEGAFVSIDNEPAGSLPLRVTLPAGAHAVQIRAQGYQLFHTTVQVYPDREATIEARMPRALGGLPPRPEEPRPKYVHYFVGAAGGVDASADEPSSVFLGEVGIRGGRYDISSRVGAIGGELAFDVAIRYALFDARFSPFAGFGYSYLRGGLGWELLAGFRLDLARTETYGVSLVTEVQARWSAGSTTSTDPDEMGTQTAFPIIGSLQILYR